MSVEYTFNMEDPRTWMPTTVVDDSYGAYNWLTKHLAMYDRLFYTAKNMRVTYGFQPFTLGKDKFMEARWIRKLTSHNPQIHKTVKNFKQGNIGIDEFITWLIPDLGCLTIHIHNQRPARLAYLSKSLLIDREVDPMVIFAKYLENIEKAKTPSQFIDLMQTLTMS